MSSRKKLKQEQRNEERAFSELFSNISIKGKVFLLTSAFPMEDKNYVSVQLARTAAKLNNKVLLVEADGIHDDIKKYMPKVTLKLNFKENPVHCDVFGFDILLLDQNKMNSARDYNVEAFVESLKKFEQNYDFIFIHCPPTENSNYTFFLSSNIGKILFSISHNNTSTESVEHSVKMLKSLGSDICGTVFTQVKARGIFNYYSKLRSVK